jgi:pimeloyl-ACP methyl ester carboxylesterase
VVGQSVGAALVLHYALGHPDRVSGVVVTNSMSSVADRTWPAEPKHAARVARYEEHGAAAFDTEHLHPDNWPGMTDDARRPHLAAWAGHRAEGMAATFQHTVAPLSLRERLPGLVPPVLLVHGRREVEFEPAAAILRTTLPDVEVVELDGGHMVNQDRPAEFNAAVGAFLRRIAAPA